MTVRHLLLTRFNLRVAGLDSDKSGEPVLGPDWMQERLDLFERYCAPSVRAQSNGDFTWLLFLDQDTSEEPRSRIRQAVEGGPDARLVFLPPVQGDGPVAAAALEHVGGTPDLLVTTRLDNDDALHEDALGVVRARARSGHREFLNLRFGYVTDGRTAQVKSHKYGHYATLVEPASAAPFRTVHCGLPHGRARQLAPVRQITDRPYWLEVIHARNAANRALGAHRRYDLTSAKGLQRWLRFEVIRPARRWFWPAHYRHVHPLEAVAGPFNLSRSAR